MRLYNRVLTPQEVVDLFNTAKDATPPSTPIGLSAPLIASSLQVDLAWSASADPESGISAYVVYRDSVEVGRSAEMDDIVLLSPKVTT